MSIKHKNVVFGLIAASSLIFGFQNCTQTNFTLDGSNSSHADVGIPVIDPVSDPIDPVGPPENSLSEDRKVSITTIKGSLVLVCNKDSVRVTGLQPGSSLVLVNSTLTSVTSISSGAEVLLVDSQSLESKPQNVAKIHVATDEAQKQQWIDKCNSLEPAPVPASTPHFMANQITVENMHLVPTLAGQYQLTSLNSDVNLIGIHTNRFSITSIKKDVKLKVRTQAFSSTNIEDAIVEIL